MLGLFIHPNQLVQFTLVFPVLRLFHKSCAYGIVAHVIPFFMIAFAVSHLPVPAVALPKRRIPLILIQIHGSPHLPSCRRKPERFRREPFPILHPLMETMAWTTARRAEEMRMVGHDGITPDQPVRRRLPCIPQAFMRIVVCKHPHPFMCHRRDIQDDRTVVRMLLDRISRRMPSVGMIRFEMICYVIFHKYPFFIII